MRYITQNLGGEWRYEPSTRRWVCKDGRYITREVADGVFFLLWSKRDTVAANVTHLVRPPMLLEERRSVMRERDARALSLHRRGFTYKEIARKLERRGPHSETRSGTIGEERARRIVLRAKAREEAGNAEGAGAGHRDAAGRRVVLRAL